MWIIILSPLVLPSLLLVWATRSTEDDQEKGVNLDHISMHSLQGMCDLALWTEMLPEVVHLLSTAPCSEGFHPWQRVSSYVKKVFCLFVSGALISHEKFLLQINTEREIGNMGYKLGQVCTRARTFVWFLPLQFKKRKGELNSWLTKG